MNCYWFVYLRMFFCAALLFPVVPRLVAEPTPQASAAFNSYVAAVESRLATQHGSASGFLAPKPGEPQQGFTIEQLPGAALTGALLHHWRATTFAAGATAADLERLLKDFDHYGKVFAPQVLQAHVISQHDGELQAFMRVRQHHVITVVMDSTYDVSFSQLDRLHRFSTSRSTRIAEIAAPGTPGEHVLGPGEEHGFLWRQNTYWSYEQRDGGLYLQVESVSLSRSIPRGLGWAVQPFVESVPRESLEFTLRSTCNALHQQQNQKGNDR